MKKALILFGLLTFLFANPTDVKSEAHDNKSTLILNKVSKTYKNYKSIKASFTVNVTNKQNSSSIKQSWHSIFQGKEIQSEYVWPGDLL